MYIKLSNIVNSFTRELIKFGYTCKKSDRTPGRSYYFKCEKKITIRLSDHHLHPKQVRNNYIDVIINNDEITVNGKEIIVEKFSSKNIAKISKERILLECKLYGKPMPVSRQ